MLWYVDEEKPNGLRGANEKNIIFGEEGTKLNVFVNSF